VSFRGIIGWWTPLSPHQGVGARRCAPGHRCALARLVRWGLGCIAACAALAAARAQETLPPEYQIKAAFLFNFVQFVEWPEHAFSAPDAPIRIGVLGPNPFQGKLVSTVQGETVRGRPLAVEHSARLADLLDCHLIFVGASERAQLGAILNALAGRPVLTVGETPDFARRGGVVNFYLEGQKVRFEINRAAAQRQHLRLASQMVKLARLVGPEPEERK